MSYQNWNWTGYDPNKFVRSVEKEFDEFGRWMDSIGDVMGLDRSTKSKMENVLSGVPIAGDFLRAKDNWNQTSQYMANRGLGWDDVLYPASLRGVQSGVNGLYGVSSFVSKNIDRLYE